MHRTGGINEQHPQLLPALAFSVLAMLIPEAWILRPLLSMFGFGPEGPVKGTLKFYIEPRILKTQIDTLGSAVVSLQSYFWGAEVGTWNWFSLLQAAGMGVIPTWAGLVIKAPLVVGGLLATLFNRG